MIRKFVAAAMLGGLITVAGTSTAMAASQPVQVGSAHLVNPEQVASFEAGPTDSGWVRIDDHYDSSTGCYTETFEFIDSNGTSHGTITTVHCAS